MKTKLKRIFLRAVNTLPSRLGYLIYHQMQMRLTGATIDKVRANMDSFGIVSSILKKVNLKKGYSVLEIGSGWMPLMPYLFRYMGEANDVYTYDINQHYDNKYIDELNEIVKTKFNVEIDPAPGKYHIPDFVKYFPKSNVITSELPERVDLVFSRFVLEHVTPDDLLKMHQRFANDLPDETLILHLISPSDHRAYSDKSLSHYDFLQYTQKEWNKIQTKFDYHNRLRLPHFIEAFENSGYEILHLEYDKVEKDSGKYRKFKKLEIDQEFLKFTEEEILAGAINILLRKKKIE
jgi:hypothetical protein